MKLTQVISTILWITAVLGAVYQGITMTAIVKFNVDPPIGIYFFSILMPIIFFSIAGFISQGRHPYDAPTIRKWVNEKYGAEKYESYTRAIKPLLLFSVGALILGFTSLINTLAFHAEKSVNVISLFFISSGIGFFILRAIITTVRKYY
jgi:hypothetical protein